MAPLQWIRVIIQVAHHLLSHYLVHNNKIPNTQTLRTKNFSKVLHKHVWADCSCPSVHTAQFILNMADGQERRNEHTVAAL